MISKYNLPDQLTLPGGTVLQPVIGGHLNGQPFLTKEHAGVDVTQSNWGTALLALGPDYQRSERNLIIAEAKRRRLKYRQVRVLSHSLRGKLDLHHRPYTGTHWIFVEVKPAPK